jgi:hypothetical protein
MAEWERQEFLKRGKDRVFGHKTPMKKDGGNYMEPAKCQEVLNNFWIK